MDKRRVWLPLFALALGTAACGADTVQAAEEEPAAEEQEATASTEPQPALDADPDAAADPNALSPAADEAVPPASQSALAAKFAPHLHLHPDDGALPANVDWYLARVAMRFHHDNCPDHELLPVGKVTQAALVAQSHEETKSFCRHDGSKRVSSTTSTGFFLEVGDRAAYKGAPRTEWKTYVVRRPRTDALVDLEYWAFYPFNDNLAKFNHESDWENVRVTIDPKGEGGSGSLVAVRFSQHNGSQTLEAGSAGLTLDGTHPISYVAKGSHANYPKVGTFPIAGTVGIAKDETRAAKPENVWKTETTILEIGTRAAPVNGQIFVKYWGLWGELGELGFTSGVSRHFP